MSTRQRPNILWYCTDQQRSDTIHALGNSHIHTPVLDQLIENGVGFTQAYCQTPICTPSRATFLTGRYPATHHVHRNGNAVFPEHEVLVTKLLADAGYDCGLVGKLHLAGSEGKIEPRANDGYRMYGWSHHPYPDIEGNLYTEWLKNEKGVNPVELYSKLEGSYGVGVPTELHQTTWCSNVAIQFISEQRDADQPWLLSMNPFAPHPSFHPPQEYLDRYTPEEIPFPLFQEHDIERQKAFAGIDQQTIHAVNPQQYSPENDRNNPDLPRDQLASIPPSSYDARLMKACYYAEIELVNDQLGRVIDVLRDTGQLDNTIIIFMSDHGELLGDHGLLFKGCRFFEALAHVPLIISGPGFIRGVHSDALVELVDIAPTLLEAAGLDVPYYMQGKSLLPLLTGKTVSDYHKPHVFCEYNDAMGPGTMDTLNHTYEASHGTMYFDGRYKLVVYHGHTVGELYDLKADPGEFNNLWDHVDYKELKAELLLKHLDAFAATSSAGIKRVKEY
ncbi:sulfatase-like hydrolase/transferase [candidate division KSB3 bacterium]|uniref:Sulfatase-like hydrolase/transferase n=1 Tax=candidate division KSB3 bacterium TaxID=2044937 RepID=A0A9D5JRT7_9BACT|nr:sulfatase-like hydrolase/transferase [candidate division KSB3 bacterium]MBD3323088.1 sulfatase-like hydrolase/transferase [candidate division KSB3 bacterium]